MSTLVRDLDGWTTVTKGDMAAAVEQSWCSKKKKPAIADYLFQRLA